MMVTFLAPDAGEVLQRMGSEWLRISCDGPTVAAFFEELTRIDVSDEARVIQIPTLVIHGEDDPVIRLENGRELASLIPNARFEIIPGANHEEGTFTSPKARQLIADFLAPTSVDSE